MRDSQADARRSNSWYAHDRGARGSKLVRIDWLLALEQRGDPAWLTGPGPHALVR